MFIAEDVICVNGEYYFAAKEINAICSFNENDGIIKILKTDESGDIWSYRKYGRIFKYGNQLIFLPLWASCILIYNIDSKIFETISIKKLCDCPKDCFFSGLIIQNQLVMVGCKFPAIAILDLTTKEMRYYEEPYKELLPLYDEEGDCFFRYDIAHVGSKVYMASCLTNQVLEFDVSDCSFNWHEIGDEKNSYSGIAYDGKRFWLSPRKGNHAVCWNIIDNSVKEFVLPMELETDEDRNNYTCLGAVYDGKHIVFPGMNGSKTFYFASSDENFENKIHTIDKGFVFYTQREEGIYALNDDGELDIYSSDNIIEPIKKLITTNDKILIAKLIHDNREIIYEGYKDLGLSDYICMVTS